MSNDASREDEIEPPESIRSRLLDGETLVWWGRPLQGLMLVASDALIIPFSIAWVATPFVFWHIVATPGKAERALSIGDLPIVLVGLFLVVGRFVLDAWLRRRIVYAVTDRRVLITWSSPWESLTAFRLDRLPETHLTHGWKGRGSIRFGPASALLGMSAMDDFVRSWVPALKKPPRFLQIEEADAVFAAIHDLSARHAGTP